MVAVYLPPAWAALVPVILIEAAVGVWWCGVPWRRALLGQAAANAVSTIAGLPVTWALLALVQLRCCGTALGLASSSKRLYAVTVQAPWLIPYEDDLSWMVPVAFLVLTIPFWAMSVVVEYAVLRRVIRDVAGRELRAWVVRANFLSYAFLLTLMAVAFAWPAPFEWPFGVFRPVSEAMMRGVFWLATLGASR